MLHSVGETNVSNTVPSKSLWSIWFSQGVIVTVCSCRAESNIFRGDKHSAKGIQTRKGLKCFVRSIGKWKKKVIVNKMNFIYLDVILDFSWLVPILFFFFKLSFHLWHLFCPCDLCLFLSSVNFSLPQWVCLLKIDELWVWSCKGAKMMQRFCRKSLPWTVSWPRCKLIQVWAWL